MTQTKATATKPQLAHTARQMFETRWAKYNDPHNPEWDLDDITDKWERHAWSAFLDLQSTEAERDALLSEVAELREACKKALTCATLNGDVRALIEMTLKKGVKMNGRSEAKCQMCKGIGKLPTEPCSCGSGEGCSLHDESAIALWGPTCPVCKGTGRALLGKER